MTESGFLLGTGGGGGDYGRLPRGSAIVGFIVPFIDYLSLIPRGSIFKMTDEVIIHPLGRATSSGHVGLKADQMLQ